jgi:hypothetical protein
VRLFRYHFLFFFQAANLKFLGLNMAWSLNILSAVTMVCMLALVMSLGQLLFNSRAIGRIGSAFFFFSGSLVSISFFRSQPSITQAWHAVLNLRGYLRSGYSLPGRGLGNMDAERLHKPATSGQRDRHTPHCTNFPD